MRLKWFAGYAVVLAIGGVLVGVVQEKAARDEARALAHYRAASDADAMRAADKVQGALTQIYQNIRTISLLPGVKKIDRHATNLDPDANRSIQEIYNNLTSNVAVSEVYIVPSSFEPDRIDPLTSQPEAPIKMYDDHISEAADDAAPDPATLATKPEEVEIYEYRQLRRQIAWLKRHYPTAKSVTGLDTPVLSGSELVTCDNSVFEKSHQDSDRIGFIMSVPFFGPDGALAGTISAITRVKAFQVMMPVRNHALINPDYHMVLPSPGDGQQIASAKWIDLAKPDPDLFYSRLVPIALNGPRAQWSLWVGLPKQEFTDSLDMRALRDFRRVGLAGVAGLVATCLGVTTVLRQREQTGREIAMQNARFAAALANMSQALCMFDVNGRLLVANGRVADMFGLTPEIVTVGATLEFILAQALSRSTLLQDDAQSMCACIQQFRNGGRSDVRVIALADGRLVTMNYAPVDGDTWLLTLEDITERKQAEAKITHMAHHDALTGLPNRVMFHSRLTEAVARSRRGEAAALLYLDLDQFKGVNDALGHPVGDALLQEVSQRLILNIREIDMVARLGGDEFAIIQTGLAQPENATTLAGRVIEVLSLSYDIHGHQITIGASIGIATIPADGQSPDVLLRNADMALYGAKKAGRGCYCLFEPGMDALMQARLTLETDLRTAVIEGQFEVYYQPLMKIKTGSVVGFEALLRWNHPKRGLVPPSEFIPLTEEIGLIIPLGLWVLQQACRDAAAWPGDIKVAVNVSVSQFGSCTLVADVAAALAASGLAPQRLELEITETAMLDDTDAVLDILYQLRALGLGIAMDDFGTGYSSLNYLRRFPFSKVKIDRSFIAGLGRGAHSDAIVTAVTNLCETLGMMTLAEGVETEEQLDQLRAGTCDEAQGYLFSRPQPASEVAAMCARLQKRSPNDRSTGRELLTA